MALSFGYAIILYINNARQMVSLKAAKSLGLNFKDARLLAEMTEKAHRFKSAGKYFFSYVWHPLSFSGVLNIQFS